MSLEAQKSRADEIVLAGWSEGFTPDPDLRVSEWAAEHRMLSQKATAEPGHWRNERTPYLVEIMDSLSPHDPCERVVFMKPAQIGGTEAGNNWIGYVIHHAPGPMLMVMPTEGMLKKAVRQRLDPMFDESPALRERVSAARSRDAANNMNMKDFPGGMLLLTGAQSASALRSMPIRYLFGDELDAWPLDVDGEGDPLALAEKRTTTFRRRKVFLPSTPTIKGLSRIEREFKRSDQRRYFVPCPHCGHLQHLRWKDDDGTFRLRFDRGADGKVIAESVMYMCEGCAVLIEERHKTWMMDPANGARWIPTAAGDGKTKGYHLNGLYSPLGWKSWAEIAAEFLDAKPYPELLKTWTNTVLAETWEDEGATLNTTMLQKRVASDWEQGIQWERQTVPANVAVVVQTVDIQDDRLECKTLGFGAGEESWLIDYEIIWGNPSTDASVWERLDEWRHLPLVHAATQKAIRPAIMLIDTGDGGHQDAAYDYIGPRQAERVFAIKGRDYLARPGLAMESTTKRSHIRLFLIATHACKDRIFSRLRLQKPGPGYLHLPQWIPEQYLDQLTAERKVVTKNPRTGVLKVEWLGSGRKEVLDTEVYALAALFILQNFINPSLYRDLAVLHELLVTGQLQAIARPARRVRNPGVR